MESLLLMGEIMGKAYFMASRLPIFKALKEKLEGQDAYCVVYLNQQTNCNPNDLEAVYTIDPQTKFPSVLPYDMVRSDLSGLFILDKTTAEGFRQGNTKILHVTEVLDSILKIQGDLIEKTKMIIGVDTFDQVCNDLRSKQVVDLSKPF